MYTIKKSPEDFIVKEIPDPLLIKEKGRYSYFWLKKTDYNTIDAIKKIAGYIKVQLKNIGFAGTKDRKAITEQIISIPSEKKKKAETFLSKNIKLEHIGEGETPVTLGDLKGNEFIITIKDLKTNFINRSEDIPNLFGPQRFSKNNSEIGKLIVKKEFKKAAQIINSQEAKEHLEKYPSDAIGAIRQIPLKTRKMYVHAYQSEIWNKTAKKYIETDPKKNIKIPLIGFLTNIKDLKDSALKKIIEDILKKEQITQRDFIIPQIKELSSKGAERDLFINPENLKVEFKKQKNSDEDNIRGGGENKYIAVISFSLPKGSYATIVIDYLFKEK